MVDFNSDSTVAQPAVDVMRILILQHREYFIDSAEVYTKELANASSADTHVMRARMYSYFLTIHGLLRRRFNEQEYDELVGFVSSHDYKDLMQAFIIIEDLLDDIGLTKVDVKLKLGGNIRDRNKAQGWK